MTLGGGGIFNNSVISFSKDEELFINGESFVGTAWADPFGGKLGLHTGTSVLASSDVPDDKEVSEDEGEALEEEARDTDLSGLTGVFFSFSGDVGEFPFGE